MAKEELGKKRNCPSCGARFYDLQQSPATCPKCAHVFEPESLLKSRRQKSEIKVQEPAEPTASDEIDDDLDEDDDNDTILSLDDDDADIDGADGGDDDEDEEDFTVIDPDLAEEDADLDDDEDEEDLIEDEDEEDR